MSPADYIYTQIYKGALHGGACERKAKDHAVMGLDDYKRNKYAGKPSRLIEERIKMAKRAG